MRKIINITVIFMLLLGGGSVYSSDTSHLRAPLLFGDKKNIAEETDKREEKGVEEGVMAYGGGVEIHRDSFSMGQGNPITFPEKDMSLTEIFDYLETHPNDYYMYRHLDSLVNKMGREAMLEIIKRFKEKPTSILLGFLVETQEDEYPEAFEALKYIGNKLGRDKLLELWKNHLSPIVRQKLMPELTMGRLQLQMAFEENRSRHIPLSKISPRQLAVDSNAFINSRKRKYVNISESRSNKTPQSQDIQTGTSIRRITPEETMESIANLPVLRSAILGDTIVGYGFNGMYMMGIPWKLKVKVDNGRNHYTLTEDTGNSGKGMTHASVQASAFMEVIERFSAFAGITENFPNGYVEDKTIIFASRSELTTQGLDSLDPNSLSLKFPYADEKLNWVWGEIRTDKGSSKILIPADLVFLQANFDEPKIYANGSSNGLASGNVMEEAKLHALLEIVERDGDYSVFYSPEKCFTLDVTEEEHPVGKVLSIANKRHIKIQFLDLTTEFGIPTYRAFVKIGNNIVSGSGAHLDGKIAIMRALGEINTKLYTIITGIKSGGTIALSGKLESDRVLKLGDIPDYSTGNVKEDLALTEEVLIKSGFTPIYSDLTRKDLNIPVVRAIVPGLEIPDAISERQILHLCNELERLGILGIAAPEDFLEKLGLIKKGETNI